VVKQSSREQFSRILDGLAAAGAQGVIYGCTEIENLVHLQDNALPLFVITRIQVKTAVEMGLKD